MHMYIRILKLINRKRIILAYYSPSKNTESWLYVWNMAMEKKLQIRRNAANRPWCSSCGSRGDQENFPYWRTESNSPWYWKTKNKCLGLDCLPMISSLSVFLPRASVNLHTGNSCESSEVCIHFLKMLTELVMCVYTSIHILAEISSPWFNKAAKPIFISFLIATTQQSTSVFALTFSLSVHCI